jgi:hypothetical protein
LTAQRILAIHLHPGKDPEHPVDTFWPDTDLDLSGAALTDLDLSGCHLHDAQFDGARFVGNATFKMARFAGDAKFEKARFAGDAKFTKTLFASAWFEEAEFADVAWFERAQFADDPARVFPGTTYTTGKEPSWPTMTISANSCGDSCCG